MNDKWIPVKDALPDGVGNVLVVIPSILVGNIVLVGYYFHPSGWAAYNFGGKKKKLKNANVTHWMPLPEPPK